MQIPLHENCADLPFRLRCELPHSFQATSTDWLVAWLHLALAMFRLCRASSAPTNGLKTYCQSVTQPTPEKLHSESLMPMPRSLQSNRDSSHPALTRTSLPRARRGLMAASWIMYDHVTSYDHEMVRNELAQWTWTMELPTSVSAVGKTGAPCGSSGGRWTCTTCGGAGGDHGASESTPQVAPRRPKP